MQRIGIGEKGREYLTNDFESATTEPIADENAIKPVQYNLLDNSKGQMRLHQHAKNARNVTKICWQDMVKQSQDLAKYHIKFIKMLSAFKSVWDGHPGLNKAAQHSGELLQEYSRPIHSVPYRVGPKMHQFEKNEFAKMVEFEVIEPPRT